MTPEEISKKAQEEKEKLNHQKLPKPEKIPTPKTYNAFSFKVYRRICPGRINVMLWFMLNVPALVFYLLYYLDPDYGIWMLYTGFSFTGVFLLRWSIDFIQTMLTYKEYKNFLSGLGYKVEGWEQLGSRPNQLNRFYWSYQSFIGVELKEGENKAHAKLIDDALFLFTVNANKFFYEARFGGDGRKKWETVDERKVMGSSNIGVIGQMYVLLNVYLKSIQEKYQLISVVRVYFDSEIFEVEPPPSSD